MEGLQSKVSRRKFACFWGDRNLEALLVEYLYVSPLN